MDAQVREYGSRPITPCHWLLREIGRDNHPIFFESAEVRLKREPRNGGVTYWDSASRVWRQRVSSSLQARKGW